MIENEFRNILASYTTLNVYLNHALDTQKAPYVTTSKVSGVRNYTNDGIDGTVESRFNVSIVDKDYKTAKTYASQIYFVGTYTSESISSIRLANELDEYDSTGAVHQIVLSFIVRHYE